ncbi:MAG: hypothetical protein QW328_01165 [Nitrososphaerota archaeon]
MSSLPSTFRKKAIEKLYVDTSGLSVYRWLTEASMQELEDKVSQRKFQRKLERSLENVITFLLFLYRNQNIYGRLYVPRSIVGGLRTRSSRLSEPKIFATMLSWMAKCPIARNIVLTSGGGMSYTTPVFVSKLANKHDDLKNIAVDAFEEVLKSYPTTDVMYMELAPEETTVIINADSTNKYVVSGRPDVLMWITGESLEQRHLVLACELTLMSAIRHLIYGEMTFYITSLYINYGFDVAGLLINPKYIYLILPKIPTDRAKLKEYFKKEGVPILLLKLFRQIDEERAAKYAEELRNKKPWICALCDLRNLCPISGEI